MKKISEMSDRHLRRLATGPGRVITLRVSYGDTTNPSDDTEIIIPAHDCLERHGLHELVAEEQYLRTVGLRR